MVVLHIKQTNDRSPNAHMFRHNCPLSSRLKKSGAAQGHLKGFRSLPPNSFPILHVVGPVRQRLAPSMGGVLSVVGGAFVDRGLITPSRGEPPGVLTPQDGLWIRDDSGITD